MSDAPLLLMTPGPTRVPERVLRAGSRPMIHHRTPEFSRELATVLELLAPVFGTTQAPLPVHTTGRGGLEAVICNLFSPGDEIAACCNGKFGELWAGLAETYGLVVHRWAADWQRDANPQELADLLDRHRGVKAVTAACIDSSSAIANDIQSIARVARAHGALTVVDAVSSLAGAPFQFDAWDVDVAVTASQKCLMSSPGLAFISMSDRAWAAQASAKLPRSYWDLAEVRTHISKSKPETPGTPPVQVMLQVAEALRMIHDEGLDRVYARHDAMAARTRAGIASLGLTLQCPSVVHQSRTMTAVAAPDGIAPKPLRDAVKARGVLTAAGIGRFETAGFRIGHMGDIRMDDVERTLSALGDALVEIRSHAASATTR